MLEYFFNTYYTKITQLMKEYQLINYVEKNVWNIDT